MYGPPELLDVNTLGLLFPRVHSAVKILGMYFNDAFKIDKQISFVVKFLSAEANKVEAYLPLQDLERLYML